jgi:ketosteroid isomerase-like protein
VNREQLVDWMASYERLWRTPGTDGLAELFTPDATYSMAPYEEPVAGLPALGNLWEAERRSPDEDFELTWEPVAVEGDTAVVRVHVMYGPPRDQEYRDLWVLRFDAEGRCASYEEWPFWPEKGPLPQVEE